MTAPPVSRPLDMRRAVLVSATGAILVVALWTAAIQMPIWWPVRGTDFGFYRDVGARWLQTGSLYLPAQLAGPYQMVPDIHFLYPPNALFLFVPFALGLPAILWWAVPLGVLGYALWVWRPAMWTWPILTLGLCWFKTQIDLLLGNTNTAGVRRQAVPQPPGT